MNETRTVPVKVVTDKVEHAKMNEALRGLGIEPDDWSSIQIQPDAIILVRRVEVV